MYIRIYSFITDASILPINRHPFCAAQNYNIVFWIWRKHF